MISFFLDAALTALVFHFLLPRLKGAYFNGDFGTALLQAFVFQALMLGFAIVSDFALLLFGGTLVSLFSVVAGANSDSAGSLVSIGLGAVAVVVLTSLSQLLAPLVSLYIQGWFFPSVIGFQSWKPRALLSVLFVVAGLFTGSYDEDKTVRPPRQSDAYTEVLHRGVIE